MSADVEVGRLRELARLATSDAEVRAITARVRNLVEGYTYSIPDTPIEQACALDSRYRVRDHLVYLSNRVAAAVKDVESGKNRRLVVSMPPRSGKSRLLSQESVLWLLRKHPEWQIVMVSYDASLVGGWAGDVRKRIEDDSALGVRILADGGASGRWRTEQGGGIYTTSVRGGLSGRGANVMMIDDPVKDFVEAHSPDLKQFLWDWFLSVALTRLEPPYLVLLVMCMTGDTPVLMADGMETPLRDVRPGDEIATYEKGRISTARVLNWANQGPDNIYEIRMESGRVVRANARHPFLTADESGNDRWQRTDELRPGTIVRALSRGATGRYTAGDYVADVTTEPGGEGFQPTSSSPSGGSGAGSFVIPGADSRPRARVSARRATARFAELQVTNLPRITPTLTELRGSSTVTGSQHMSTPILLLASKDGVPYVTWPPKPTGHRPTGRESSASTMTRTPESSADFSATGATSSFDVLTHRRSCALPLTTLNVTTDRVVEVTPAGCEDVYDLQVERTENFIANGLVSHNTRWSEDDIVGRVTSREYEGDPDDWEQIIVPAVDVDDAVPMISPLLDETPEQAAERWREVKEAVGPYKWHGMYLQRPMPAKGSVFDQGWWRYWTTDPSLVTDNGRVVLLDPMKMAGARWLDSWDMAFKDLDSSDYVVGQRWMQYGPNRYLIDQVRARMSFTVTLETMLDWTHPHVHQRLIEDKANGTAIINALSTKMSGIKPISPRESKVARARAVTPECASGHVYLPHPSETEWVADLLTELRAFPTSAHDDQVDALSQALSELRSVGRGGLTVPGRTASVPTDRDRISTARADLRRPLAGQKKIRYG